MILLAYSSRATFDFTDGDLITLLMNSRANNRRLGITGLLLHDAGRFIQVLEGDETTVRGRYDRISRDPRHSNLNLILDEVVDERRFPKWSMGYKALNDPLVASIPGFNSFFSEPAQQDAGSLTALLERFRQGDELTESVSVA